MENNMMRFQKYDELKIVLEKIEYKDVIFNNTKGLYAISKNQKIICLDIIYEGTLEKSINANIERLSLNKEDITIWTGEFTKDPMNYGKKDNFMILNMDCLSCLYENGLQKNTNCKFFKVGECGV